MSTLQKTQPSLVQVLEEQKKRLAALQERRTRAQVKLETDRAALTRAKAEALEEFGTDDLPELREKYRTRVIEDEQVVMDFMMALDTVEQQLADIERQVKL